MLKWLLRKIGLVNRKEIDYLIAENALLRAKVVMLERDITRLREENLALSEKVVVEQQKHDARAVKSMLEELDLLLLETLEPVGDA